MPAIPRPVVWGGVPEEKNGVQTGNSLITADGLAELGGYLIEVQRWMTSAAGCLAVRK